MKMFPHAFFPFYSLRKDEGIAQTSVGGKTTEPMLTPGRVIGARPIKIDVEKAVTIMLATSEVKNDSVRQKLRLDVIKAVPSQSIDWNTVDWVQIWPFKTVRQ